MASILIINDNYDTLEMMRVILGNQGGHAVSLSAGSLEGLKKAKSELPDLAIVDVMMPEMNGYDVVRELRSDPSTKDMRIIILTARG